MIHFIKQGESFRLGLNIAIAKGGFVAIWMWMDIPSHIATKYRFRLRLHMRPWIIWEVERQDIFIEYLKRHDFDVVSREVINDLKAMEATQKRVNEPYAIIKPK
jgi:hypothetical protein